MPAAQFPKRTLLGFSGNRMRLHRLYKMLRMKVITRTEGDLEMSGVLTGNIREFGERETTSTRASSPKWLIRRATCVAFLENATYIMRSTC